MVIESIVTIAYGACLLICHLMTGTRLYNRAVVQLSAMDDGEDVIAFLQGLVTNDVEQDAPIYAGLLTPQGKTLFDFIVWRESKSRILIDCEAPMAEALVKRLSLYRLRRRIEIALAPEIGVYWSLDPASPGVPDPRLAALGYRWLAPAEEADIPADEAWLAHRLSHGVVEGSAELEEILWLETNAADLHGVSFEKGCYIGQENTARMNWRQKVNRRLVVIPLGSSDEKRRKAAYPELKFAIDHLRIADINPAFVPDWMQLGPDGS